MTPSSHDVEGPPPTRRATKPLLVSLEAAAIGVLAFLAAGTRDGDPDVVLVVVGWVATAVAGACAVAFAFRTGARDRAADLRPPVPPSRLETGGDPASVRPAQRSPGDRST